MNTLRIDQDWTFSSCNIAENFDRHVREQLPWYDLATGAVVHIARHYLPRRGTIYDIGASTGNIGRAIAKTVEKREARFIPIEESKEMASVYTGPGRENLIQEDVMQVDFEPFDVAILFLTLMFISPENQKRLLYHLRKQLRLGGVIIIMDKMEGIGGYFGTVLTRLTLAGKVASGVLPENIITKELSLCGIQRPLSLGMMQEVGGREWFRFGEFVGWVIER